jgi:hypothetical protein
MTNIGDQYFYDKGKIPKQARNNVAVSKARTNIYFYMFRQ